MCSKSPGFCAQEKQNAFSCLHTLLDLGLCSFSLWKWDHPAGRMCQEGNKERDFTVPVWINLYLVLLCVIIKLSCCSSALKLCWLSMNVSQNLFSSFLRGDWRFDCLSFFAEQGLDHIAENILSYLDARSLCAAELVCKEWQRVISEGMLWKKLIERMVRTDPLWKGLSERRGW